MGRLADVLGALNPTKTDSGEKTAQVSTPTSTSPTALNEIKTALDNALSGQDKTAQVNTANNTTVQDVEKMAKEIVAADDARLQKEAEMWATVAANTFMERLGQFNNAAVKVAGSLEHTDMDFKKFASENPEMVKEAHDLGYQKTAMQLNALKQAAYERGVSAGIEAVHKAGSDTFIRGFTDISHILDR